MRTGASSERYTTFSSIRRSENAPSTLADLFHLFKSYDISATYFDIRSSTNASYACKTGACESNASNVNQMNQKLNAS